MDRKIAELTKKLAEPKQILQEVDLIKVSSLNDVKLVKDRKTSFEEMPTGEGNRAEDLT